MAALTFSGLKSAENILAHLFAHLSTDQHEISCYVEASQIDCSDITLLWSEVCVIKRNSSV